ncbi:unnamed protein product, partial [Laminaria digitata]
GIRVGASLSGATARGGGATPVQPSPSPPPVLRADGGDRANGSGGGGTGGGCRGVLGAGGASSADAAEAGVAAAAAAAVTATRERCLREACLLSRARLEADRQERRRLRLGQGKGGATGGDIVRGASA